MVVSSRMHVIFICINKITRLLLQCILIQSKHWPYSLSNSGHDYEPDTKEQPCPPYVSVSCGQCVTLCLSVANSMIFIRQKCHSVTWSQFFKVIFPIISAGRASEEHIQMTTTSSSWLRMTDRCCETNSDSCNLMNKYQPQQCSFSVLWLNIWTKWTVPCSLQQKPVCHPPQQCTIQWQVPAVLSCRLAQNTVILLERHRSAAQIALRQQDQSRGCAQQTFLRLWSAVLLQTKLLWYLKKRR